MSSYWDDAYRRGHRQNYPWDSVVSFVFRNAPRNRSHGDVAILEVGFGTGANLWFAAREGFNVAGIEASEAAVSTARERFDNEKLSGDLRQGSFTALPFDDGQFDLIIDRASLTCSPFPEIAAAIDEIARVAKSGARFLFNPYADTHTSARSGDPIGARTRKDLTGGSLAGLDRITFLSANDIFDLLGTNWQIESMKRLELTEMATTAGDIHAEWRVTSQRL